MKNDSKRIFLSRLAGPPIAPAEMLENLLDHLRRGTSDSPFAETIQQRYERALAKLDAYDRSLQAHRPKNARNECAA